MCRKGTCGFTISLSGGPYSILGLAFLGRPQPDLPENCLNGDFRIGLSNHQLSSDIVTVLSLQNKRHPSVADNQGEHKEGVLSNGRSLKASSCSWDSLNKENQRCRLVENQSPSATPSLFGLGQGGFRESRVWRCCIRTLTSPPPPAIFPLLPILSLSRGTTF